MQFAFAQWLYGNSNLPLTMKLANRTTCFVMPIGLGSRKARPGLLPLAIVVRIACVRMPILWLVRMGMLAV